MRHDLRLRAAARAIYDACFPTEDTAPAGFDDAERFTTIHCRRAVEAARLADRELMVDPMTQLSLF